MNHQPFPSDSQTVPAPETRVGYVPLEALGRRAIRRYLKRIQANVAQARKGEASEGVHTMRIATRGLRATLEALEETPAFDAARLDALRRGLRGLARALGAVRDLDVFLDRLAQYAREHPDAERGLRPLRDDLRSWRASARKRLRRELERGRTRRLLDELHWLARRQSHRRAPSGDAQPFLTRYAAGGVIWRRYEALLAFEPLLATATPDQLHRLRIACKRLRYVLELFDSPDDAGYTAALAALREAQSALGLLHDTFVALEAVEPLLAGEHADAALLRYTEGLAHERDTLYASRQQIWDSLGGPAFRQRLAAYLAAL